MNMINSKPKNQLSFVRETLEFITSFSREDFEKEIIYNCTLWNQMESI